MNCRIIDTILSDNPYSQKRVAFKDAYRFVDYTLDELTERAGKGDIGRCDWLTTHRQFACNGGTGPCCPPEGLLWGARTKGVELVPFPCGIGQ